MLFPLHRGNASAAHTYTATDTHESVVPGIMGDFAVSLAAASVSGTWDVKIQESPDPDSVADGSADWYDLVTFAQFTGATTEKVTVTSPHFGRLRLVVTETAAGSADIKVLMEGLRVGSVNRQG